MVKFPIVFRCISVILLFLFSALNTPAEAADITNGASIVNIYNTSDNSVERRTALNALSDVVVQRGLETPQWVNNLLIKALDDKSPVVVNAAVYQIGNFGLTNITGKLSIQSFPHLAKQEVRKLRHFFRIYLPGITAR